MRVQIAFLAILFAFLLGSSFMATAQTGEFASPVPGSVVHNAWELQDRFQNARSGGAVGSVSRTARSYDGSKYAKPATAGVTTTHETKGER
jgi:hypothetical protein